MKAGELRDLTEQELSSRLFELIEDIFNMRFKHVTQELTNPLRLRTQRREIARIKTLLKEKGRSKRGEKEK